MAVYSTRNRLTGLSGIDTETMISQLMKAETLKLSKLQKNSTKLTWKQEAYWTVADSLKSFQSKFLDTMSASSIRMSSSFNKYNSTVKLSGTDISSNAVKVSASGSSAGGTYKLEVEQLAQRDVYTSGTVGSSIASKDAVDLNAIKADGASFKLNLDGSTKNIEITQGEASTLNDADDLAALIKTKADAAFGAGKINVNASGGKLSIEPTGKGHNLTISEGSAIAQKVTGATAIDTTALDSLKALLKDAVNKHTINFTSDGKTTEVEFDFSKWKVEDIDAADMDKILSEMNKQMSSKGVSAKFEAESDGKISIKTTSLSRNGMTIEDKAGSTLMTSLGFSATGTELKKTSTLANLNIVSGDSNTFGADDKLKDVFAGIFDDPAKLDSEGNYTMKINDTDIILNKDDSVEDMMKKINTSSAGVKMTYDKLKETFTLQANAEGANNKLKLDTNADDLFAEMTLNKTQSAQDAKIKINGVETTRESNNFSYNGVSFTLNEVTSGELTIEVTKDTSNAKQMITDFVNAYNTMIEGINGMVDEAKAKTKGTYYEPLTDEEKKAMSEDEIKKWETTAKQGILNRDSILSDITSSMRTQLYQSVTLGDGSKLALYQIGITTSSDYKDQGKLVIDDAALDAAIEKYGDKIGEMFTKSADNSLSGAAKQASTGIGDRLNNIVDKAINTSKGTISMKAGAKTGYTSKDNDLLNLINAESRKITDMLTYLAKREDHYYSMFAKMESAMAQNDSQMNYLGQMFGM